MLRTILASILIVVSNVGFSLAEPTSLFGVDFFDEPKIIKQKLTDRFRQQASLCTPVDFELGFVCRNKNDDGELLHYYDYKQFYFDCETYNGCEKKLTLIKAKLAERWSIQFTDCSNSRGGFDYCYESRDVKVGLNEFWLQIELSDNSGLIFD